MTFESPDDVLEHFGVKGMRWGVRKSRKVPKPGSFRSLSKSDKRKVVGVVGGTTALIGGAAIATAIVRNRTGLNVAGVGSAPIRPFKAAGKNWLIQANDGHTFDVLVRNLAEQGK